MPVIADKLFNVSVNSCWPLSLLTHKLSINSGFVVQRQGPAVSLNHLSSHGVKGVRCVFESSRGHEHVRTCVTEEGKGGSESSGQIRFGVKRSSTEINAIR